MYDVNSIIECAYSLVLVVELFVSVFIAYFSAKTQHNRQADMHLNERHEVGIHFTPSYVCVCTACKSSMYVYDSLTVVGKGGVCDMMIDEGAGR